MVTLTKTPIKRLIKRGVRRRFAAVKVYWYNTLKMGEKITQRELDLIRSEVMQKYLEDRGIAPSGLKHLNEAIRKAVEDDKTRALIESGKPITIQPARKSWQDNVWLFLLVGIVIGIVAIVIANLILS